MGDRTRVVLTVLTEQADTVKPLIAYIEDSWELDEFTEFQMEDINYGELGCLHELRRLGIAYNSAWCAGDEYGAGTEYCRFMEDGTEQIRTLYDDQVNPDIQHLMALMDNLEALRDYILEHHAHFIPPSWDNQVLLGKKHVIQRLIDPTL